MADNFENLDPKKLAELLAAANKTAANSLKDYNAILKEIGVNQRTIVENNRLIENADKEIAAAKSEQERLTKGLSKQEKNTFILENKRYRILQASIKAHKHTKKELKQQTEYLKISNKELKEAVNSTNLMAASFKTIGRSTKKLAKDFWELNGAWGEVINWQKEIQKSEKAMGVLSSQAQGFRTNIQRAATSTNQLGINAGELAKMQGAYSEQVGRSVQLSQKGLEAMSEMAAGTMLGADGASEMAANMEQFGVSAVGARDRVEEMMDLASNMGVNSVKVTKNLKKNMQLANRFHFKDGVKGMVRLAAEAAKMRLDMEGIASMADKVFRPEGAVEMAARLQTMGGEFAKLADPFELMFKARNDFEAFSSDIGNATKEFAKFNAETGEFDISGAALDRIKEISDITGIGAESLAEMGRNAAKLEEISMQTNLNDENSAFVSSIASFNDTTQQWEATVAGQTKNIKDLENSEVKRLREEKQNLKERAKQAQTFDETWNNLKNTFKTMLLPVLNGLSEGLKEPMQEFMRWMDDEGGFEGIFEAAKKLGTTIGGFMKGAAKIGKQLLEFVADNPVKSGIMALIGSAAIWMARGHMLGIGFNSVASVGGMGGGIGGGRGRRGFGSKMMGGLGNMFGGRKTKAGRSLIGRSQKMGGAATRAGGGFMKGGKGLMGGLGKGLLRGGIGGLAGGLAGMGLGSWRGSLDDQDSGLGKGLGVAGNAASWAGTGAMIGSIIPGLGTGIGALIGGLAGAGKGIYDEFFDKQSIGKGITKYDKYDDVIMRNGEAPIAINPSDDIIAAKKNGPLDKVLDKNKSSDVNGNMNISFSPIKISGSLELTGEGASGTLDMDDPIFMRDLSKVIQQEVRKAIGGGKLNPNPA